MEQFERRFADWVLQYRLLIIVFCVAACAACASSLFIKPPSPTTNYRVFFSKDNPELREFEKLEKTFSKNDNVLFVLTPKNGTVYTRETLKAIHWLSNEARDSLGRAWTIKHSMRVDSITNFQHTTANDQELKVASLVADPDKLSDQDLKRIKNIVQKEPTLVGRVVSKDGRVAGVNVTIEFPGKDSINEPTDTVRDARKVVAEFKKLFPNIEIRLVGMVMFNNAFNEASQNDAKSLYTLALGMMTVFLILLLRNISSTVMTLVVMIMSIMTAFGLAVHLDTPLTPPSMSSPIVILTVAVANSVHVLVTFVFQMRQGADKTAAIKESLRINVLPVFLTSLTTTIGFLTMNFSEVPPFQHLGNIVAAGVVASFIFSITFLPAVLSYLPIRIKPKDSHAGASMGRFADFVIQRRRALFFSMLIAILVLIAMIPRNELNDIFLEYFSTNIPVRVEMDYTNKNLTGLYQSEYSVESGQANGIKQPKFLNDTEKFVNWLRTQPEVIHVYSFLDTIKRVHKSLLGDRQEQYRIPQDSAKVAGVIFTYENGLPQGFNTSNQINIDKSATRITVNLKTLSTKQLLAFEDRVQAWLKANAPSIQSARGTGPTMMFSHISMRNIVSMLTGSSIALILISIILIVAFRSLKIGLISMIPNLVPAAMGFGVWGLFSGQVGLALSMVIGMSLGIVVDDTVHFLSKYLRARREQGLDAASSIRYAFSTVGYALVTTSIVLIAGFLVLAMSDFKLNADMGLMTAMVIVFALLADFLFLPALLMKLEGKSNEKNTTASPGHSTAA